MELPDSWTLIAVSTYRGGWESLPGAILSVGEARAFYDRDEIYMAQRRLGPNQMGLLIRRRPNG
jgi:hypothetical protein